MPPCRRADVGVGARGKRGRDGGRRPYHHGTRDSQSRPCKVSGAAQLSFSLIWKTGKARLDCCIILSVGGREFIVVGK